MIQSSIHPHPTGARSALGAALRSRGFVVLWLSEALSQAGDRLAVVALVTLVYERTASASAVGLLMLLKAVPALALGSLAGVFVDRWSRKWIMVFANLIQGLLVFCLPFSQGIALIFAIYLAMSVVSQFFVPARSAAIPDLVPPDALTAANALFAVSIVAAIAVGPALGAWITERVSLNAAFYADAATFLVPAAAVAFLSIPRQQRASTDKPGLGSDLRAGLAFARSQPAVLAALGAIGTSFLVVGTISIAGVVIISDVVGVEASRFGVMMSAMGVGMLTGALVTGLARRRARGVRAGAPGLFLMALGIAGLPWSPNLAAACVFAGVIGAGMITVQVNCQTLLQTIAPEMRGRLMGLSQTLTGSITFLASALVGLLIEQLNAFIVLEAVGAITLVAAASITIYDQSTG